MIDIIIVFRVFALALHYGNAEVCADLEPYLYLSLCWSPLLSWQLLTSVTLPTTTTTRGVIDMGHIDISITLLKQYSLLSLVNTYISQCIEISKTWRWTLREEIESWILLVLLVTYFLKTFLYMVMPHFFCCLPRRSNKMRQDPHKMVKNQHKCFMIFYHGIDSISMDISMHRIEIIKIENN